MNVTLLFAVEAYEKVAGAFILGLERRRDGGESLDVHSVASFFVSRVDTEVDKRLAELGKEDLRGIAAVADARAADVPGWAELTDNGFDLLPGESRLIGIAWIAAPTDDRRLRVDAWNVAPVVVG